MPAVPVEVVPYDPVWIEVFAAEREKIFAALGHLVDGGSLDAIEHFGSTSIPEMCAKPTIDMMARMHPYPPSASDIEVLESIGYTWRGEYGLPGRTYFTKGPHDFHLHLVGFESDHWERHLVFRDYLRATPHARERYATLKLDLAERFHLDRPAYQDGKTDLMTVLDREATDWHLATTGFSPIERLVSEFADLPAGGSWAVASGWALDLHLGSPGRYHDDLDVEIDAAFAPAFQRVLLASGWRLDQVVEGGKYAPWPLDATLLDGSHQVHARRGPEFMDLLLARRESGDWLYRHDERVRLPLTDAVRQATLPSGEQVPYLAPEAVLLFKSRSSQGGSESKPRNKDEADFERVLPSLNRPAREWLAQALRRVHGNHPWLHRLESVA